MNKRLIILFAICFALIGVSAPAGPGVAAPAPAVLNGGCTVIYGSDGQTVLGGNNEDLNNPFTQVWFIPASQGQYGRVYFGYDDMIPQGGMNDQGVFFDDLALPYKAMPLTSQRPRFPAGDLLLVDQALAMSANVQEVIEFYNRWYRPAGEYYQRFYGDRFGNSAIFDGDTVLRKQGTFQLATNFRLVENPNPPYPEERYGVISEMLSKADHFSVDLFRQALAVGHAEGDYPTLYSQVYELKTGIIHLYQYHDFQHEVVLNLADELAKGPHAETIASLFPENPELKNWTIQQGLQWKASYQQKINAQVQPASLAWMSGEYTLQEEAKPVKIYLKDDQLYLQKRNEPAIELYPTSPDTVFHHYFNGEDLTLTFQPNGQGQASGARGALTYEPYNIEQPYHMVPSSAVSANNLPMGTAWAIIALVLMGGILWWIRKRAGKLAVEPEG